MAMQRRWRVRPNWCLGVWFVLGAAGWGLLQAQSIGDRPLAVPQESAAPNSAELQRLPTVRRSPAPRTSATLASSASVRELPLVTASAASDDVVRLPQPTDQGWGASNDPYTLAYVETRPAWIEAYHQTGGDPFLPAAWMRWLQQGEGATGNADGSGSAANGEGANGEANKDKKPEIGPKPPEDVNKQALRGITLLLKPGDLQYELSPLFVTNFTYLIGALPDGSPTMERVRGHLMILPISLRYGWRENTELFAITPFGLSTFSADNPVRNVDDAAGVLGDISLGFVRNLPKFTWIPNTTLTVNLVAPTGVSPDATVVANQAALGNGVWRIGAMLNFIQSVDPFVLYAGIGYDHPFQRDLGSLPLQLGDSLNFYMGTGFSVTDDLSLSAQIGGSIQAESQLNGIHIPNSDIEPTSVRFAVMRRLTLKSRVQPFATWGVTPDAADYSIGVRFVHDR